MIYYSRGCQAQLTQSFKAFEFDCKCGICPVTHIEPALLARLQALRDSVGMPVRITEGYRCQEHQRALKAAGYETSKGKSTHERGEAADIWTGKHTGPELEVIARAVGFESVGVGKTFIHVDLRPEFHAWRYSSNRTHA